jgi:hypothetical protein
VKLSDLLSAEVEAVELEMDASGHTRVLFDDKELAKVNAFLKASMDSTYDDWAPIWNRSVENKETYRTVKVPIPDGGRSMYPAPIARIPADQVIASVYNAIMRPRPVFSIDAYLKADYDLPGQQVAMPPPQPAAPGMASPPFPRNVVTAEKQTAERVAHRMEQGYDFVARERIGIGPKLMRGIKGAVTGSPYWWKVVADPEERTSLAAKSNGATIDLDDKYEETRLRGDLVKWYLVPFTNAMMPLEFLYEEDGIDRAPWFAERLYMRPDDLAKRYAVGDLFLIADDDAAGKLAGTTVDAVDEYRTRAAQSTERKSPSNAIQMVPNWLTWFFWDVKYVDPNQPTTEDGKKSWRKKRLSLLGDFHLGSGQLMTCWMNEYEHRCRPYELVDQMDEGDCTVDRLMYAQTMFTYAAQSEIKSAHIANTPLYWHDPNDPDLVAFFASHKVIGAGEHVPGIFGTQWGLTPAGEKHYSMLELMKFFISMSQLDSKENDFTSGGRPPGRTPADTTRQVYQHAEEVKTMFLARLSLKLGRLLRLDAETRRQYQPLGETLPVWDEEAKGTIEIPFRFPVGDVLDNFRIALTAADEALSEEKDPQQIMMRKQAMMADGEYVAKIIAAIVNIQNPLPETAVKAFAKIIARDQQMMRKLMGQMVTDEENYDLTPEIEALIRERNAALQAKLSQPPSPPKPPEVKLSISGKMTPEQEAAAAENAGIGAGGSNVESASGPNPNSPGGGGPAGPGQSPGSSSQPAVPPNGQ